jgi:Mlc titration factor MtfA (ptsG expression regulator)
MRDRSIPPLIAPFPALASASIGVAAALFAYLRSESASITAAVALGIALAIYFVWTRRDRRRRKLARAPFPSEWRESLASDVGFYRELAEPERARFEREVRFFIDEHTIVGPRGADVSDEVKLLVAASAVVLVFGRAGFRYPRLRDIVVYEGAFDEDYTVRADGNILGMVHAQGPILFSARSLRAGFRGEHDGRNVGYHELAHVLDFDVGQADGVPAFMPWRDVRPWVALVHREIAKVKAHRSLLREYAAENEAEFFAVATEMFFERGAELAKKHPDLYRILRDAYGQDPARDHDG